MSLDMTRRQARVLLVCGIALGVAFQSLSAVFMLKVTYDDANTYLLSTGHRTPFEQNSLTGRWVPAKEWKAFVGPPESLCFATVTRDAIRVDHHPPLFYWLLNAWTYLFGVSLATGKIPGILMNALTCFVVYRTCRLVRCARGASAGASIFWLLSAPTMDAAGETRQYCLLALMLALFIFSLLRFMGDSSKRNVLFLSLSTLGAVFTHYESVVVIGIAAATAGVLFLRRREYRKLGGMVAAFALAAVAFVALHPSFFAAFKLQSGRGEAMSWHTMPDRIRRVIFSALGLVVPTEVAWRIMGHKRWLLAAAVAIAVVAVWYLWKTGLRGLGRALRERTCLPPVVSAASLSAIWVLYLLHLTLQHAMGRKYMMVVTPVLFVAVGQMANRLRRVGLLSRWAIVILGVCQSLVAGTAAYRTIHASRRDKGVFDDPTVPIVLDNTASGIVPSVLWHASDDALVYVDAQERVYKKFPTIIAGRERFIYLCDLRMGNKAEYGLAILKYLADEGYTFRLRDSGMFEETDAYEVTKASR